MKVLFAAEGNPDQLTGGYIYNRRIIDCLNSSGFQADTFLLETTSFYSEELLEEEWLKLRNLNPDAIVFDSLGGAKRRRLIDRVREQAPEIRKIYLNHLPGRAVSAEMNIFEEEKAMKSCDIVVVTGRYSKELLYTYYNRLDSVIIEPPPTVQFVPRYRKEVHQLFMSGSIIRRKGYHVVLESLGKFRTLNWELNICGRTDHEPDYVNEIANMINNLQLSDKVKLVGECDSENIAERLRKSDIFISSSLSESYGMSAGEAVLNGIPSILSRIPPYKYRFSNMPVQWFDPGNPNQLSEHLGKYLLSDKYYISWVEEIKNWKIPQVNKDLAGKKWVELLKSKKV